MPSMKEKLASLKVLWRQDDTMSLWGVPFEMNSECGQQPRDLWEARNAKDFVWLGSPGWWGSMSKEDQAEVKAFLEPLRAKDAVPTWPNEWVSLKEWS